MVAAPYNTAILLSDFSEGKALSDLAVSDVISFSYLGARGMFLAIVVALVSVEITRFCKVHHIEIKMPESVPNYVSASFSAVIPVILNMLVFYGISLISGETVGLTIPQLLDKVLAPGFNVLSSIWGIILFTIIAQLLWLLGMHGDNIVIGPVWYPLYLQAILLNGQLILENKPLEYSPAMTFIFHGYGGCGATIGLALLLLFLSKSKQLKTLGKLEIVPALFNINEPIVFGIPLVLNPVFIIPFILTPVISILIAHFAWVTGFMALPNTMSGGMPMIINEYFFAGDWHYILVGVLIVAVSVISYYPFFKLYDKQLVEQENAVEMQGENKDEEN